MVRLGVQVSGIVTRRLGGRWLRALKAESGRVTICCFLLFLASLNLMAQEDRNPVQWSLKVEKTQLKPGIEFAAKVTAQIAPGWHIYSITQPRGGPIATTISVPKNPSFQLTAVITGPEPDKEFDPNFDMETELHEGAVRFNVPLSVKKGAPAGSKLPVNIYFQTCNDHLCLPPSLQSLSASVQVLSSAGPNSEKLERATSAPAVVEPSQPSLITPQNVPGSETPGTARLSKSASTAVPIAPASELAHQSFRGFLWLAAVMGALSLLTPCVFPMVPITVSYFANHAGASRKSAFITATIYGIGIVLTFTAFGMLMAIAFGAGGVNQLAANPWVNLFITAIFLGFAFSLFGAYFIQLPPGLMSKLDAVTRSKEHSGAIGSLLMGFTFTLTSFTCTAPFVGSLLVMTSQGNWRWPLAGMLVFSSVFATPFLVLALAPQLMSRLPRAGGWMVQLKVVMGFLEIAAAMKFLSNADLVWNGGIFTRQVVLAVWASIGILALLYILGCFRMKHDSPVESVGAARVTFAIIFLAATIWLIPGLFGRQLGELESFLPPEVASSSSPAHSVSTSSANGPSEVSWILNNYEEALTEARRQNELVFVDFTGYTCTNCRWMEANMFPKPEVHSELEKFVTVRLYTDGTGEVYQKQQKMQQEKFGTVALPLYAIVRPDGRSVATFAGLTRSPAEFISFLRHGQSALSGN